MSEKSRIDRLMTSTKSRMAYIKAHLNVIIPSQIRALRRRRNDMTQTELAREAEMLQPRIAVIERPGETNFNVETLVRLAAAFKVGVIVKFVPFSEMMKWENEFSQDTFNATPIDEDLEFQGNKTSVTTQTVAPSENPHLPSTSEVRSNFLGNNPFKKMDIIVSEEQGRKDIGDTHLTLASV